MRAPSLAICLGVCTIAACDDSVVEVGVLQFHNDPVRILVPDTARPREAVLVQIVTYGDGCVSVEDTEVEPSEEGAEITPYDRRRVGEGACPQIQLHLSHDVQITFDTAGPKTIRVHGRREYASAGETVHEPLQQSFPIMIE